MRVRTFVEPPSWREGVPLEPAEVLDKEEAHRRGLLHLSVHLLLVDSEGAVCARRRSDDDVRYPGLWTSTVGTHVPEGDSYEGALRAALPVALPLAWVGEFRVRDAHENEVCGLFVSRADEIPASFGERHGFLAPRELDALIGRGATTPHLAAAYRRHRRAGPGG